MAVNIRGVLISICLIKVAASVSVCGPDCTDLSNGTLVPDPTNCTRYYACIDTGGGVNLSEVIDCSEGDFFDATTNPAECRPVTAAPEGYCESPCSPCTTDCSVPGTLQPNPYGSCSDYYVCLQDNSTVEVACVVPSPYYNYKTEQCEETDEGCYTFCDDCTVYCTVKDELFPDPDDCQYFYLCDPPYKTHLKCPDLQNFDPYTRECSPNVSCVTCHWQEQVYMNDN